MTRLALNAYCEERFLYILTAYQVNVHEQSRIKRCTEFLHMGKREGNTLVMSNFVLDLTGDFRASTLAR